MIVLVCVNNVVVFEGTRGREIWTGLSQPINQVFLGLLVTDRQPFGSFTVSVTHSLSLFLPVAQTQTLTLMF